MLLGSSSITQGKTSTTQSKERSTSAAQLSEGNSSNLTQVELPRLSSYAGGIEPVSFVTMCKRRAYGFMEEGTSKQYQTYLTKWQQYCIERNIDVFELGVSNDIEFIVFYTTQGWGIVL